MSFEDSGEAEFKLRQEFSKIVHDFSEVDDVSGDPEPIEAFGSHGVFEMVGNGSVTNGKCGRFSSFYGCLRTDLHDRIRLDGVSVVSFTFYVIWMLQQLFVASRDLGGFVP